MIARVSFGLNSFTAAAPPNGLEDAAAANGFDVAAAVVAGAATGAVLV